jgi:GNAT superfamily N-acetyltransferase
MTSIVEAGAERLDAVRELWTAYWNDLGFTPCFQGFETEMACLPGRYARPSGCLLIATVDGAPAGAVAYRRIDDATCEAKRLFVHPAFRGHRLGRSLMERLIAEARGAGYRRLVGDTLPVMADALALYDRMGFRRTEPYAGSTDGAIYIEYTL